MSEHDAYREQRKTSLYWLRKVTGELDLLDKIEDILPSFVQRRYRIGNLTPSSLSLWPQEPANGPEAADALHADVDKLYTYLLGQHPDQTYKKPRRTLVKWSGQVGYSFSLNELPGFKQGLRVEFNGLPAGSNCQITKKVTGYRMQEESEYEMVCEDEPVATG